MGGVPGWRARVRARQMLLGWRADMEETGGAKPVVNAPAIAEPATSGLRPVALPGSLGARGFAGSNFAVREKLSPQLKHSTASQTSAPNVGASAAAEMAPEIKGSGEHKRSQQAVTVGNIEARCAALQAEMVSPLRQDTARWGEIDTGGVGASGGDWRRLRCDCVNEPEVLASLLCFSDRSRSLNESVIGLLAATTTSSNITSAMQHTERILSFGTRVPGEMGWQRTIQYITTHMTAHGWAVEKDAFEADTPFGRKKMVNLIASEPNHSGVCLLDLAAHFESKYFPPAKAGAQDAPFVGATDSAAPVALLLQLAEVFAPGSTLGGTRVGGASSPCLRFIFFDGEEVTCVKRCSACITHGVHGRALRV